jgi:hypothetical protein
VRLFSQALERKHGQLAIALLFLPQPPVCVFVFVLHNIKFHDVKNSQQRNSLLTSTLGAAMDSNSFHRYPPTDPSHEHASPRSPYELEFDSWDFAVLLLPLAILICEME